MKKQRLKRYYDLTFTISMTDKQYRGFTECQDEADGQLDINPGWEMGKAALRKLQDTYGVKSALEKWSFCRNDDFRVREP